MDKLIDKISNYHLFNNLIPGYLFLIISSYILEKNIISSNLLFTTVLAYFIGIIISRISSLIIEPLIIKIRKVEKKDYSEYVCAANKDDKIEIFNQDCNMYRSLCTLMIIEIILKICDAFNFIKFFKNDYMQIIILFCLAFMFAMSYVKQIKYICSRISVVNQKKNNKDT